MVKNKFYKKFGFFDTFPLLNQNFVWITQPQAPFLHPNHFKILVHIEIEFLKHTMDSKIRKFKVKTIFQLNSTFIFKNPKNQQHCHPFLPIKGITIH